MKNYVEKLIGLQDLDTQIFRIKAERDSLPKILREKQSVIDKAQKTVDEINVNLKNCRKEAQEKSSDLKADEADMNKQEEMLKAVKSNKEFQIVKSKMQVLKEQISKFEQTVLEELEAIEKLENDRDNALENIETKKAEYSELETKINSEMDDFNKQIEEINVERTQFTDGVPRDVIATYDRVCEKNQGSGLAPVMDGVCQGCYRVLNVQEINNLMAAKEMILCVQCSRIQYLIACE